MSSYDGLQILPGNPLPLGATLVPGGVNFAIASWQAVECQLVLFHRGQWRPFAEIAMPSEYRFGAVFAVTVLGIDAENVEYGYRMYGPRIEEIDAVDREVNPLLLDPYARAVGGREVWAQSFPEENRHTYKGRILTESFNWEGDRPLNLPIEDLIIYEMHVRGFTRHPSSGVEFPGTYAGMQEKIPYLKDLGINAVELLPVWEFDEWEHSETNRKTGQVYLQYWGYSPISFFAPKTAYGSAGDAAAAVREFKSLIKALHQNGIEVILDVVMNHTGEGSEDGPVFSFKGMDSFYYLLTPEGHYYNFSGTGNAVNCNHPAVIPLLLDCLRYWVAEYHIDGFRFDLASVMTRDVNGMPLSDPPLLRLMSADPVLRHTKFIAEPWDVGGLYQVGSFPHYGRWSEWNGQYRDTMRSFLKGDPGQVARLPQLIQGSPNLYGQRGPTASINFITVHDGFTLLDLVSYNQKHNDNPGGPDHNISYNYGHEGPTRDAKINTIRRRQVKNALTLLLMSQGVPLLLMGDEAGRTQKGNNNAYRQDSPISWFDWKRLDDYDDIYRYMRALIAFRKAHPAVRAGYFYEKVYNENPKAFEDPEIVKSAPPGTILDHPPVTFHGTKAYHADYSEKSRVFAYMFSGEDCNGDQVDDHIYVAANMGDKDLLFELPALPNGMKWRVFASTGAVWGEVHEPGSEPLLHDQKRIMIISRSVAVLVGR